MKENKITDPDEALQAMRSWAQDVNLTDIVNFHNVTRALLKQELERLSLLSQGNVENKEISKQHFKSSLQNYDEYLTHNTFLMMYSHVEEWLLIHVKSDTDYGGALDRFTRKLKQKGLDTNSSEWQHILKAEKVRNCILHANRRISFVKNSDKPCITQLATQQQYFGKNKDRLVIKKEYLNHFQRQINKLFEQLI